jgi:hypothetical protein
LPRPHPFDDTRPVLGTVVFDSDGLSDRVVERSGQVANVGYYAPEMILELVEKALTHQPQPKKAPAGIQS